MESRGHSLWALARLYSFQLCRIFQVIVVRCSASYLANIPLPSQFYSSTISARSFSSQFPERHAIDSAFLRSYVPGTELGAGSFGFVIKAFDRTRGQETAVKFIRKDKVKSWVADGKFGRHLMEIMIITRLASTLVSNFTARGGLSGFWRWERSSTPLGAF
ncbi:hypothetical protein BC835DRAFT_652151 [Cytidiella melzeri]|nr:hypothetical protein BC835DRAFT_652151 [Cytidiella melzeri]